MPRLDAVRRLLSVAEGMSGSPEDAIATHAEALICIGERNLSHTVRERLVELCDELVYTHQKVLYCASGRRDMLRAHARGESSLSVWFDRRRCTAHALEAMWSKVAARKPRSDGYTIAELKGEGDIGQGLWTTIRKLSGVEVKRGQSTRRFKNSEILRFIEAAEQHGTPESLRAAAIWRDLLHG